MQTNAEIEDEALWWVRYVYLRDVGQEEMRHENAFFYARDEEQARKKVERWQHSVKHDEVRVESMVQVPLGFDFQFKPGLLQELPKGARLLTLREEPLE
jgi:hypothetical protein